MSNLPVDPFQAQLEERFLSALRYHFSGLRTKARNDFSQLSLEAELAALRADPVYASFAFDSPEYVLVRLMGRFSIAIGRRLGDIYDKLPRFVAATRFGLAAQDVAPRIQGLELDIALRLAQLAPDDRQFIERVAAQFFPDSDLTDWAGFGIEIRYNFNPNDSARLRKDVSMVEYVRAENLLPVYLIFASISPRSEAIARLTRAGWHFLVGNSAAAFAHELLGLDLASILEQPKVKSEVQAEVTEIMKSIFESPAFEQAIARYSVHRLDG